MQTYDIYYVSQAQRKFQRDWIWIMIRMAASLDTVLQGYKWLTVITHCIRNMHEQWKKWKAIQNRRLLSCLLSDILKTHTKSERHNKDDILDFSMKNIVKRRIRSMMNLLCLLGCHFNVSQDIVSPQIWMYLQRHQ